MAVVTIDNVDVVGDTVTVTGTVDGVQVTIQVWASHLSTLPTKVQKRTYVAQQLKAVVPAHSTIDLSGTPLTV